MGPVSGHATANEASVHDPPRGDRAIPCNGGSKGVESPVAKGVGGSAFAGAANVPMVRPQSGSGSKLDQSNRPTPRRVRIVRTVSDPARPNRSVFVAGTTASLGLESSEARRAHPESYAIHRPDFLHLTPARLRIRWATMPAGPQDACLFYSEAELPEGILSNWFVKEERWTFKLPAWCGATLMAEAGLPTEVDVSFAELPIMLCKAGLMGDTARYGVLLRSLTPQEAKATGRRITPWDESKWQRRVCAVALSVTRQKAASDPRVRQVLLSCKGKLIAEAAPKDRLWGTARASSDPLASSPNDWLGANVLGWSWMQTSTELSQEESNQDEGPIVVEVPEAGPSKRERSESPPFPDTAVTEADMEAADMFYQGQLRQARRLSLQTRPVEYEEPPVTAVHSVPRRSDERRPRRQGGVPADRVDGHMIKRQAIEPRARVQTELAVASDEPVASVPLEFSVVVSTLLAAQLRCTAFCIFVTTLLEPLVFAHADGDTHIGVTIQGEEGNARGINDRLLDQAEGAVRSVLPDQTTPLVPAGLTHSHGSPVIAAPVAFVPPPQSIVRSPRQRRRLLSAGATFAFMTISALAGTPSYHIAAPALVRINSFVRPAADLQEAMLAGAVLADAVRFHFGGREVSSLVRDVQEPPEPSGDVASHCRRVHTQERELFDSLRAVEGEGQVASYQRESAQSVQFLDLESVPDELCRASSEWAGPELDGLPFSHECPVPVTDYVHRKPPQPPSCGQCAATVTRCDQFIMPVPRCTGIVQQWWDNATFDFEQLRLDRRLDGVRRTRTIALGRDCFIPCARECWFDCRSQHEGVVVALDYHQPIGSQLDRASLRDDMRGWPDQALASYVELGAVLTPDMPHMLVLPHQLTSLADGFSRAQEELAKLVQEGWYALFRHLVWFPGHLCPKGCTERKLESDRPRPTTDGSNPPCFPDGSPRVYDTEGRPVYSPNWRARRAGAPLQPVPEPVAELSNNEGSADGGHESGDSESEEEDSAELPDLGSAPQWFAKNTRSSALRNRPPPEDWAWRSSSKWDEEFWKGHATWGWYGSRTPEFKPNLRDLAHDQSVLQRPAQCTGEALFQICDDWKNAFMHIRVRPEDWPKSGTLAYSHPHLAEEQGQPHILFVAEYVLGFGHTDNSGTFQRWASYVQHEVMREMDLREAPRLAQLEKENPCFAAWAAQRKQLSLVTHRNEYRVHTMHFYSDDSTATCVGGPCVHNWLASWNIVNRRVNMIPAILAKRAIGTQIKWLGALPNPQLGYLTVPKDKLLKVQEMIDLALSGQCPKSAYRSLLGFLEWFAWCFVRSRSRMWGLYAPLRGPPDDGTAVLVQVDDRMHERLTQWKSDLWQVGAVGLEAALPRRRRQLPRQAATFFVSMDESKEGTDTPGLAGWCHGWTWSLFYPQSWLQLPIAVHEFLAFAVSVIVFEPFLRDAPRVVFETDSISTAFNLELENAHSTLMQIAFELLIQTKEWMSLVVHAGGRERASRHVKGKINIFADAESRGYHELVSSLCAQLGITRKVLDLQDSALDYLNAFVTRANPHLPSAMQALGRSPACNAYDGPSMRTLEGFLAEPPPPVPSNAQQQHTLAGFMPIATIAVSPSRPSSAGRTLQGFLGPAVVPAPPPQPAGQQSGASTSLSASQPSLLGWWEDSRRLSSTHADSGYSLTGMQVAAGHTRPNSEQPNARGYAPGSRYSINPPKAVWDQYLDQREAAMRLSFPPGSRSAINCHFEFWKEHCAVWGCATPIRDNFDAMSGTDPIAQRDELDLAGGYVLSRYFTMQARKKGDVPKVESAFQSYLHISRTFSASSVPRLPQKELRQITKGMTAGVVLDHGIEVVLPHRKQPVNNATHDRLAGGIPEGTRLGPFVYYRESHFGRSWRRLLKVLDHSGFRKGEWAVRSRSAKTLLTYRQLAYCFDNSDQPVRRPSVAQLRELRGIVWMYLYPVPSKCDPNGKRFCTKAIPFRMDRGDPNDVVALFVAEELRMHELGVSDADRAGYPLFSSEDGQPLLGANMDVALQDALALFLPKGVAEQLSWHSWRIRLACKLHASGKDHPTIKAAVRWTSDESVAIYARWERDFYLNLLQEADAKDTTSVQFTALPEIDEGRRVIHLMGWENLSYADIEKNLQALISGKNPQEPRVSFRPPSVAPAASAEANSSSASGLPRAASANAGTAPSLPKAISASSEKGLPPGFTVKRWPSGKLVYCSPNGKAFRTKKAACASVGTDGSSPSSRGHKTAKRGKRPPCVAPEAPPRVVTSGVAHAAAPAKRPSSRGHQSATRGISKSATRGISKTATSGSTSTTRGTASPRVNAASNLTADHPDSHFQLTAGRCGTLGCVYRNFHLGPCSNMHVEHKRKRACP